MVKINLQVAERLQALADLPRKAAGGVYATLVGTTLSRLSILNLVAPKKMGNINIVTSNEFVKGSSILLNIYMSAATILKPNSFNKTNVYDEYTKGNQSSNDRLNDITSKVNSNPGIDIKSRLRFLRFGAQQIGFQSAKFLAGTASMIASIPFPTSSKVFALLNSVTIGCSSAGNLPSELYISALGIIKPSAAATLLNPNPSNPTNNNNYFDDMASPESDF